MISKYLTINWMYTLLISSELKQTIISVLNNKIYFLCHFERSEESYKETIIRKKNESRD